MIVTEKMRHLTGAVLDIDNDAVTSELLRFGLLDLISFQDVHADWKNDLKQVQVNENLRDIVRVRERIETLFGVTNDHPGEGAVFGAEDTGFSGSLEDAERQLDRMASDIQRIREEQRNIHQELTRTRELQHHLSTSQYLVLRQGSPVKGKEAEFRAALSRYPSLYLENGSLITLKRDEAAVTALLGGFGWKEHTEYEEEEKVGPEADRRIAEKQTALKKRNSDLEARVGETIETKKPELQLLWKQLRIRELSGTLHSAYGKTARTFIFSGWVPAEKEAELDKAIRKASDDRCYLEWRNPLSLRGSDLPVQVPVIIKNPRWLRPFEKLVINYAVPSYGTVDPTLFVAIFYCTMFGLMFGDAGHGLVVFLIGLLGGRRSRKEKKKLEEEHFLFPLFRWCGLSAMVAGILFGSWFGMPLFPPLWFDYHGIVTGHRVAGNVKTITDILMITIYFGIIVISFGLLLNWYNRIVRRDWIALLFDKGGITGGWLYAAGTWCAFYFVRNDYRRLPDSSLLMLILGVPALLIALKPLLEWRKHHRGERPGGMTVVNFLMEWIVELLEIFSGYLSNTLSFMRVAGLGIAHVSLMVAFTQIAGMAASNGRYTLWSYLILLFGNILVIGLEGLSAGIQSLRLNYYEFFSKYFDGSGRAYAPVTLK